MINKFLNEKKRNPSKNVVCVPLTSIQLLKARVFNPPPTIIFPLLSNLLAGAIFCFFLQTFQLHFLNIITLSLLMNEIRTQRLSCFHILIIDASVCGNLITTAIVYDLAIILSALSIVPFFCNVFSLRRNSCSVECPRACEVSDWTEWSR